MNETFLDPNLPGAEIVEQGLADLKTGKVSESSLLLRAAGPTLRRLGLPIPDERSGQPYHHLLYERLEGRLGDDAYSHYNSLIRRIVSYTRALEQQMENSR